MNWNSLMTTQYDIRFAIDPDTGAAFDTQGLRDHFLADDLFAKDTISLTYTHYDRMIVGGVVPANGPLTLEAFKPTGTRGFLGRCELIAVKIGGKGKVSVA